VGRVARDWESWLRNSIGPASDTEEADRDRTERRIRDAIIDDARLRSNVRVFVKGSYANNTNVRRDSDVDIAVEWKAWAYVEKANEAVRYSWDELGVSLGDSGPAPPEYRRWVEDALVLAFGGGKVDTTGNKAITVAGGSTTLDADVVPCFRLKRYDRPAREPHVGIRLSPKNGGSIENWPEQNRANGTQKNRLTGMRFKELVRAMKRLENDMVEAGRLSHEVHSYFLECLLFNLSDDTFMFNSYKRTAMELLARMWNHIKNGDHADWVEENRLKWLWRGGQTWTPQEASDFAYKAWNYMNSS
jgi:hypothetical protein